MFILNCEFVKDEFNFNSETRKILKLLIISAIILNLFPIELTFRCPIILKIFQSLHLNRDSFTELVTEQKLLENC